MSKFKRHFIVLITIILLNPTPTLADCKVNTEIYHTKFSSGLFINNYVGGTYNLYENGLDKYDLEYMKEKTDSTQLFEAEIRGKTIEELFEKIGYARHVHLSLPNFVSAIVSFLEHKAKNSLCVEENQHQYINVQISFISMEMAASKTPMRRLQKRLAGLDGSYANLDINRKTNSVKATIIWNPRRMFRDLFILKGWDFGETEPVLPFKRNDVRSFKMKFVILPEED